RLVDLEQVDVLDRYAGPLQRLLAGLDRAQAHDLRRQAAHAGGDDAGQRLEAEFLGLDVAGDHHRRRAVVQRAGVARGNGAVGPEDRLELADLLVGGAGARAVVLAHRAAVGQRDRDDLALEEAALDGLLGTVLAAHTP